MRFVTFILLFTLQLGFSQIPSSEVFDFAVSDKTIPQALHLLSDQTSIPISFSSSFFSADQKITLQLSQQPFHTILEHLLADTDVTYKIHNERVILHRKAKHYTFSGYIEEYGSQERLIAATIYCPQLKIGTISNEYGFFSLTLPQGIHQISCSYLGFQQKEFSINLSHNYKKNIALENGQYLTEVIVVPDSLTHPYSLYHNEEYSISSELTQVVPSLGGEKDPIRTAAILPGIQSNNDGLGGLHVRGGESQHNLMLLDGANIYIPYHLLGIFSIYNANIVKSSRLMTGSFSPKYGGALSSIFDIRTREGNLTKWEKEFGFNLARLSASIEGPLKRNNGSMLFATRFSHTNFLFNPVLTNISLLKKNDLLNSFYIDTNLKLNHKIGKKGRIYLSSYYGQDVILTSARDSLGSRRYNEKEILVNWRNSTSVLRWNHLFNDKLFSNVSLSYSSNAFNLALFRSTYTRSDSSQVTPEQESFKFSFTRSNNIDISLKVDFDWTPNNKHHINFGAAHSNRTLSPLFLYFDQTSSELDSLGNFTSIDDFSSLLVNREIKSKENNIYIEDNFRINEDYTLRAGVRLNHFQGADTTFFHVSPRILLQRRFTSKLKSELSLSRTVQYLHLISNPILRYPSDLWLSSSTELHPQTAWHKELNIKYQFDQQTYFSVSAYLKHMNNLYTLPHLSTTHVISNDKNISEYAIRSDGEVKGLELFFNKNHASSGYSLGYTLSKATRFFNTGQKQQAYPFAHDVRHQFNFFAYKKLTSNIQLSMNWTYSSPKPTVFLQAAPQGDGVISLPVTGRDKDRSSSYHRLDLELNYTKQRPKTTHQLNLGLYNAYNRRNIAFFHVKQTNTNNYIITPIYSMPLIPSFNYQIKF